MSNTYYMSFRSRLTPIVEAFNRELNDGDYIIHHFGYGLLEFGSFFSGPAIGRLENGRVHYWNPSTGKFDSNIRTMRTSAMNCGLGYYSIMVYKMDKDEAEKILANYKTTDYSPSNDTRLKRMELFQRELKPGDLVIYSKDNCISKNTHYGLITAKNKIFTGSEEISGVYRLLIENLDEHQIDIKAKLGAMYAESIQVELAKKKDTISVGDCFKVDNKYYLYIGDTCVDDKMQCVYLLFNLCHDHVFQQLHTLQNYGFSYEQVLNFIAHNTSYCLPSIVIGARKKKYVATYKVEIKDMDFILKYNDYAQEVIKEALKEHKILKQIYRDSMAIIRGSIRNKMFIYLESELNG